MDSENEFRDILRDKLNKEFSFDTPTWEQARQAIDASREEKKRRPFLLILSGLLLLLTGVFSVYLFTGSKPKTLAGDFRENKNSIPVSSVKSDNNENANINSPGSNKDVAKEVVEASVTKENKIKEPANNDVKEKINIAEKNNASETGSAFVQLNASNKKSSEEKSASKNYQTESKTDVSLEMTKRKKRSGKTEPAISKGASLNGVAPENLAANINTKSSQNENPVKPQEKSIPVEQASTQNNRDTIENNKNIPANVTAPDPTVVLETKIKDSITGSVAVKSKPDSSSAETQIVSNDQKITTHTLSAEGGINYFTGWKNPGNRDAKGYSPLIGLNYSTRFTQKLVASIGFNYYYVGKLSYSSRTSKVTTYGLGEQSIVTVITPNRLHYIGFPLKLNYNIAKIHYIGIGCNIAYLINVTVSKETYNLQLNQTSDYTKTKSRGYTEGFKIFDSQITIFYMRKIYRDLYVNTELMLGLIDVKDNIFFNSSASGRNNGIRCTLIYNLFKK